jgi:hypothetical protein
VVQPPRDSVELEVPGLRRKTGPRPRVVRTRAGEAPDWDKIDSDKVLDAWTESGGDVRAMAALLAGQDPGAGGATSPFGTA